MSGLLEIRAATADNLFLNLLSSDHFYLQNWQPAATLDNLTGIYPDIVESIELVWRDQTDDRRADTMRVVSELARMAREWAAYKFTYDFVWMAARTPTESEIRYSIIKNIWLEQMPAGQWGPGQTTVITLKVQREGFWRGVQPGTLPPAAVDETVDNQQSGSEQNWVDIDALKIGGDLPALTRLEFTNAVDNYFVGVHTRQMLADFANLTPNLLFNAGSTNGTWLGSADSDYPGDFYNVAQSGQASASYTWNIPAADLPAYTGVWNAYLLADLGVGTVARARLNNFGRQIGEYVSVEADEYSVHFLGRFDIPAGGYYADALPSTYAISLELTMDGSTSVRCGHVQLMPAGDVPMFRIEAPNGTSNNLYADGFYGRVYANNVINPISHGPFLQLVPGRVNRVFFRRQNGDLQTVNDTIPVKIYICPRYSAIRGNF